MERYVLIMKWHYDYDKEGTWFDEDDGEEHYPLQSDTSFPFPHISKKALKILTVQQDGETVCAELGVDHSTVTVICGAEPVIAFVHDSYSVCGDSVSQSLRLQFSVEPT